MKKVDSINIDLVVTAVHVDGEVWMQGDLEILINGRRPYQEEDIIDVNALLDSLEQDGEFFIFSCCCGILSCSGWEEGIKVEHKDYLVIWKDDNFNRIWTLDKTKIQKDFNEVRKEVAAYKRYFKAKEIDYVGVGYHW